jgi:hypothetical protein
VNDAFHQEPDIMTTRFECCGTMLALSSSEDDWEELRSELAELGEELTTHPTTMVEYLPDLKCYSINNVAIYFCPWCSAKLPEPQFPPDLQPVG